MKRCIECGRRGLFLKLNESGRCSKCQQIFMERMQRQHAHDEHLANEKYGLLCSIYTQLNTEVQLVVDPIERLEQIPLLLERITVCDEFLGKLNIARNMSCFGEVIEKKLVIYSDRSSYMQQVGFPDFNLSFYCSQRGMNNVFDLFASELEKAINRKKNHYQHLIHKVNRSADYAKRLRSIPAVQVNIAERECPKLLLSDMGEIKYSRVTSKSNYLRTGTFVSIDVETTGLHAGRNELIEVAAIRFEEWEPVAILQSLVKPKKPLSDEIMKLTGITNDMLAEAPSFSSILGDLEAFVGDLNIVGYNLPFDLSFLYKNGFDFTAKKRKYFDVLEIVRTVLKKPKKKWDKELESYEISYDSEFDVYDHKLTTVCSYYGIREEEDAHRAASDALATGIVFKCVAQEKIPNDT